MSKGLWQGLIMVCLVLLLVLVMSFPLLEPGTDTYIISQIAAVNLLVSMALLGALIYFDWDPLHALRGEK